MRLLHVILHKVCNDHGFHTWMTDLPSRVELIRWTGGSLDLDGRLCATILDTTEKCLAPGKDPRRVGRHCTELLGLGKGSPCWVRGLELHVNGRSRLDSAREVCIGARNPGRHQWAPGFQVLFLSS